MVALLLPWCLRVAWAVMPFTAGPALAVALDPRSATVQRVASGGLWFVWGATFCATLLATPLALTIVRVVAPVSVLASARSVATVHQSTTDALLGAGSSTIAALIAFAPEIALHFVNGPAYANERRYPLRVPGPLLFGGLWVSWALTALVPAAAALLLASRAWVAGAVLAAVSIPCVVVFGRSLHGLARRWVVFVPAGLVLHDPMSLADPVLFRKQAVESLAAAPAGSDSLDLTQGAMGLALELVLREKVDMVLVRPGSTGGEAGASARLLFTPTRPGAVLAEARARRFPV